MVTTTEEKLNKRIFFINESLKGILTIKDSSFDSLIIEYENNERILFKWTLHEMKIVMKHDEKRRDYHVNSSVKINYVEEDDEKQRLRPVDWENKYLVIDDECEEEDECERKKMILESLKNNEIEDYDYFIKMLRGLLYIAPSSNQIRASSFTNSIIENYISFLADNIDNIRIKVKDLEED